MCVYKLQVISLIHVKSEVNLFLEISFLVKVNITNKREFKYKSTVIIYLIINIKVPKITEYYQKLKT